MLAEASIQAAAGKASITIDCSSILGPGLRRDDESM
jgi:hypothetical protein